MTRARNATHVVHFRRRREGRTDYEKRLALLRGGGTRLVVRKTNRHVVVEFAGYGEKGDKVVTSSTTSSLKKDYGYPGKCNSPSAYLTAFHAARKAMQKGVKEAVLDIGLHTASKGSVVFAALKGAVDAGIKIPHDESILPKNERIAGKHLGEEAARQFEECRNKVKQ